MTETMEKTDWTNYYRNPFPTAGLLRRITASRLIRAMRDSGILRKPGRVIELGGGGSSFAMRLTRCFPCTRYTAVDSNPEGLKRFQDLALPCEKECVEADLLRDRPDIRADFVFSAGLIEHFPPEETRALIRTHLDMTGAGGFTAFLFPVDTRLYRMVRRMAERANLWRFPDERALAWSEAEEAAGLPPVRKERIASVLLTQELLIFHKEND